MISIHPSPLAVAPDLDLPKRRDGQLVVVRVTLPRAAGILRATGEAWSAVIESRDGKVKERVEGPRTLLARFAPHERIAYFTAEIFPPKDGDDLEIGDSVPAERW